MLQLRQPKPGAFQPQVCLKHWPSSTNTKSPLKGQRKCDICLCLPPDRNQYKVNDQKVDYSGGLGEEKVQHEPTLEPWLTLLVIGPLSAMSAWWAKVDWTQIWVQTGMPDYSLNWTAISSAIQGEQRWQCCSSPTRRWPSRSWRPFGLKSAMKHWSSGTDARPSAEQSAKIPILSIVSNVFIRNDTCLLLSFGRVYNRKRVHVWNIRTPNLVFVFCFGFTHIPMLKFLAFYFVHSFQIQNFLVHFWQGMPQHMAPLLGTNAIVTLVGVCDSILYKAIANVLMPSVLQALPER